MKKTIFVGVYLLILLTVEHSTIANASMIMDESQDIEQDRQKYCSKNPNIIEIPKEIVPYRQLPPVVQNKLRTILSNYEQGSACDANAIDANEDGIEEYELDCEVIDPDIGMGAKVTNNYILGKVSGKWKTIFENGLEFKFLKGKHKGYHDIVECVGGKVKKFTGGIYK